AARCGSNRGAVKFVRDERSIESKVDVAITAKLNCLNFGNRLRRKTFHDLLRNHLRIPFQCFCKRECKRVREIAVLRFGILPFRNLKLLEPELLAQDLSKRRLNLNLDLFHVRSYSVRSATVPGGIADRRLLAGPPRV